MGAVVRGDPPRRRETFGAEVRTDARVERLLVTRRPRSHGAVLDERRRAARARRRHQPAPEDSPSSTTSRRSDLPDDFVRDIERWKSRSGVVKINLALAELPNFTADPERRELAEHHTGSVEMAPTHGVHRAGVPGRPRGPPGRRAVLRRRHPDDAGQDARTPTARTSCRCSPSGCPSDWSEEPHTEELEAYADRLHRPLRRGGAELQGLDPAPRHRRPARDGGRSTA